MSDKAELGLEAELVRISRDRAETSKLISESYKLHAEQRKLLAEQANLIAQEAKTLRDWRLAPWLAWLGVAGGAITVIGALLRVMRP